MADIVVTKLTNGILFDLSGLSGAGTTRDKFVFRPATFHTITKVSVRNDFMQYTTVDGEKFAFTFDGSSGANNHISSIDGVAATDNYDLFNKFIAIL